MPLLPRIIPLSITGCRSLALAAVGLITLLPIHANAQTRAIVEAAAPSHQAVTVYRDPNRSVGQSMGRDWPRGFAMISETRQVTLPPGRSTVRFTGVAEGMVAVSAIVTGLPGGTIEKNRNADLLSPAALVDGTLGNRVRITRANPGTGVEQSESAVIRTRADGGLVLQTAQGYEAVRCSGLPERLTFDQVPDGLSAEPVFTIDTRDDAGGTYTVTLSYLAWGFDWEASYVATILEGGDADDTRFNLVSWLTILNDNGQSFEDAELMAVAGRLNVESDFEGLSNPPRARPLRLSCYPIGSTARGSAITHPSGPLPPPAPMAMRANMVARDSMEMASPIVVTGSRIMAAEEDLGDLKLYRIPEAMTVAAQSLKQVTFLDRQDVEGRLFYQARCQAWDYDDTQFTPAEMLLETVNDEEHGLGVALPTGTVSVFERGPLGEMLVAEENLRDYASGQDVELALGQSSQVFKQCNSVSGEAVEEGRWNAMRATLTNANPTPVRVRLQLGLPIQWNIRGISNQIKKGWRVAEITIPANGTRDVEWDVRSVNED